MCIKLDMRRRMQVAIFRSQSRQQCRGVAYSWTCRGDKRRQVSICESRCKAYVVSHWEARKAWVSELAEHSPAAASMMSELWKLVRAPL